jgi:hypothetical protein
MPCLLLAAILLSYANAPASRTPGERVELGQATTIHVGWVDISPDDWMRLGYENKQAWVVLVDGGNEGFQDTCRRLLRGYEVVGAKNRLDGYKGEQDLEVKFTDVRFDVDTYGLYATIVVIDSKTGTELVKIPKGNFRGGHFSVVSCLNGAFEKLAQRVAKEVSRLEKRSK